MTKPKPILILGGTSEATELAGELTARHADVVLSLAGRTPPAARPAVPTRIGGFGGAAGLAAELQRGGYRLLVNATHPFANRMTRNAVGAAELAGVGYLRLLRPPWQARRGDTWHDVGDLASAAGRLAELGARRVFLAIGRTRLGSFVPPAGVHLVLRSIQAPAPPLPADLTVLIGRGPFTVEGELAVLAEHRVEALVTRNSGGEATAAKLTAARRLGIPVIMIRRPEEPPAQHAATVTEALNWIGR